MMSPDHQYITIPLSNRVSNGASVLSASSDSQGQIPSIQNRNNTSRAKYDFNDGSDTLFSMYNEKTLEFDSNIIQNWREDANGVMLLSGLVSAAVAGFLSQSYFTSQKSSQDVSAFYLIQLYQLQATSNGSAITLQEVPVPVNEPKASHALWFASLVMSLVCAVGATLIQEWIRQYLLLTHIGYSPHRCARIRACITRDRFHELVPVFLSSLNTLLHTSIYLFLSGLLTLPFSFGDKSTYRIVLICFIFAVVSYLLFTSPHGLTVTPLSLIYRPHADIQPHTGWPSLHRAARQVEKRADTRASTLDTGAMSWLLDSLTHDSEQELERFLTGIPGFYKSPRVEDPAQVLRGANTDTFPKAIVAFMDHSLSSNHVSDTTRQRRITVSLEAVQADPYLLQRTFYHALCSTESAIFKSVDFVLLADQYANDEDPDIHTLARCIITIAINRLENYHSDERWAGIIQRRLNWSEAIFAEHCEHRDGVKLRNLVRLAKELNTSRPGSDTPSSHKIFGNTLRVARQLNVDIAALGLQNEFCDLWNQLVVALQVRHQDPVLRSNVKLVLSFIRPIYVTLHQDTENKPSAFSASTSDLDPVLQDTPSYSQCTVSSHRFVTFADPNANITVALDAGDA